MCFYCLNLTFLYFIIVVFFKNKIKKIKSFLLAVTDHKINSTVRFHIVSSPKAHSHKTSNFNFIAIKFATKIKVWNPYSSPTKSTVLPVPPLYHTTSKPMNQKYFIRGQRSTPLS